MTSPRKRAFGNDYTKVRIPAGAEVAPAGRFAAAPRRAVERMSASRTCDHGGPSAPTSRSSRASSPAASPTKMRRLPESPAGRYELDAITSGQGLLQSLIGELG
jgi:hypothetical protein